MNASIQPDFSAILAQLRDGRTADAIAALEALLAAGQDTAPVHGLLARARLAAGDREGARNAIDAGLARDRRFAPLWLESAMLARTEGDGERFLASLRQADLLMPTHPGVGFDLARALIAADELEEVDELLARVCKYAPQLTAAWTTRGQLALRFGNAQAAEESFVHAQRLAPNDVSVLRGLAEAAAFAGKSQGEIWARDRVAALAPADALAHAELGDALRRDDRPEPARAAFAAAIARRPGDLQLRWLHLNTLPIVSPDAAAQERTRHEWDRGIVEFEQRLEATAPATEVALELLSSATNFYRHYLGEPLLEAQRAYGRVLERLARMAFAPVAIAASARGRRRVAFVSSHFHEHTVWKLFRAWFTVLADRFELCAVHLDAREDAATVEAQRHVAHFVPAQPHVRDTVARLRELAPDVIVHLDVAMHPHGQVLAALRLAPLQLATWGHPVTTGLATIDGFISSAAMEPPDGHRHYSERLHRLPGLGIAYDMHAAATTAPSPLAGRISRYVFCAQSAQKLTPVHDDCFADILEVCPGHALVLVPHDKQHVTDALAARIRQRLAQRGQEPARLVPLPAVPHATFLAMARHADVVIDSLEWSGGMTTMEALSVGTPVITLPGESMRSRHTAGILTEIGRPEWIASDRADLVRRIAGGVAGAGSFDRTSLSRDASATLGRNDWKDELVALLG